MTKEVIAISQREQLGETARARLAFNMVDYITSEDLPLRLLITRAPQAIAKLADERKVYKESKIINGRKGGVIYSKQPLVTPKEINYTSSYVAKRIVDGTDKPLSNDNLLGRIGTKLGQVRSVPFEVESEAVEYFESEYARRLKRGYVLAGVCQTSSSPS